MLPSSALPPSGAGEFSCPYMVKQGPQIIVFYVCGEHVLGIMNLLSSQAGRWSHVTTVLFFGACLVLLSHGFVVEKTAWLCG